MTKYYLIFISAIMLLVAGCGKTTADARSEDEFKLAVQTSPEMLEVDNKLDLLENDTDALAKRYEQLQTTVLAHTTLDVDSSPQAKQLIIHINDNSVLIVNDMAMSKNDFVNYAGKHLPTLCTPTPKLSIHRKANYDTAAWALDTIYSHGCTNVDIE